jgi:uncharacterized protein (TIGR02453 family)
MNFEGALKFLKDLDKHNNREWFEKNKPKYIEAKEGFELFVGDLLEEMIKFDDSLTGLEARKLTFRIYRDVRFSKDKKPYKKNMSAAFSSTGKGLGSPGYYFHLEPGNKSFVGIGMFMPVPENLAKIRQEIDYNGAGLEKIFKAKEFKKNFVKFWDDDKLKTAPKGYAKDHLHVEWLKLKSFIVTHEFTDRTLADKKFLKTLVTVMKSGKPLNDFLKEAVA